MLLVVRRRLVRMVAWVNIATRYRNKFIMILRRLRKILMHRVLCLRMRLGLANFRFGLTARLVTGVAVLTRSIMFIRVSAIARLFGNTARKRLMKNV